MRPYLTPKTLLGYKFERYLNQKEVMRNIRDISFADIQRAKELRIKG